MEWHAISPAYGGTGAGTLTQGSVVYAGASGVYAQDNSNFFWDATNHRLGIGTASPSTPLHLVNSTQLLAALTSTGSATPYITISGTGGNALFGATGANGFIQHSAGAQFQVQTNGGGLGTLTAGTVGIGTATPAAKLVSWRLAATPRPSSARANRITGPMASIWA